MTLNRKILKRVNSPVKSPKLANSSLRRRTLIKRLSSGGVHFGSSSKANLKVVVRIRPENQREIDNNSRSVVDIVDDHMLIFDPKPEENEFFFQGTKQRFRDLSKKSNKEQKFMFEKVFGPDSTNEEIFEMTTRDIVDTILNGYNCSVFAYGATGSGKTYTMIGKEDCPGITFMTVMELYKKIDELQETKSCEVGVSYLEVYNEMVRDLLTPGGKTLNLHESGQHVQVTGLSLHKPKGADDLLRILADGNRNRSQHPTDANSESSRSHAVFQVFVRQQNRSSDITSGVSIAKLSMIDLAGSERGSVTGFKGVRFREGANINKSLLALGNCINALADGKGHIPYRDSKLTRLLKDSLGGNCRSVMIATITRAALSFEDTYNTLRYANRAKTIKTTVKKNFMNVDQHVSQYLKIVEDLKGELSCLKEKLKKYEEGDVEMEEGESNSLASSDLSAEERKKYEDTIHELNQQLDSREKHRAEELETRKGILTQLATLNGEVKGVKREILQLETAERELEWKIYIQKANLVKMNVFVFASTRLEKGIGKSERSVRSFETNLEHVLKQKELLKEKASRIKDKIKTICDEFSARIPQKEDEPEPVTPDPLLFIKDMQMEQSLRDSIQINEYFKNLVQEVYKEQTHNEKLTALLLAANKYFYLKLQTLKACDTETDQFLEKIYGMLDSSRIEWADLKNTDDSFGAASIAASHLSIVPAVSVDKLTRFSLPPTVRFSPLMNDISKVYKSNILKTSNALENVNSDTAVVINETINVTTPVSSRFSSLNRTPPPPSIFPVPTNGENVIEPLEIAEALPHVAPLVESPEKKHYTYNNTFTSSEDSVQSPHGVTPLTPGRICTPPSPVLHNVTNIANITKESPLNESVPLALTSGNDTFSVDACEPNSTFCIPENPSNTSYTVLPKEKNTNVLSTQNTFKKPFSMTPSKFSFSKMPKVPSSKSTTTTNRTFKRSTSVASLQSGTIAKSSNKENTMKKSTSFVTPKFSSVSKNKDGVGGGLPEKTVAFGSSFTNTPKHLGSKRSLTYQVPTPVKK